MQSLYFWVPEAIIIRRCCMTVLPEAATLLHLSRMRLAASPSGRVGCISVSAKVWNSLISLDPGQTFGKGVAACRYIDAWVHV